MEYHVTRSALAEKLLYIDGKPVSFSDYPYQRAIYDVAAPRLLIMSGRQVGKSSVAANFMVSECLSRPFFKTLYVTPIQSQASKFSVTRLSKIIQHSPLVRKYFMGQTDNIFTKVLANGSEILLAYAKDDPDRVRGISSDRIFLDEVQDMSLPVILPVIKETSANSLFAYETFAGTPKSLENGIEWLWSKSTQAEWLVPCSGCKKYNICSTTKVIGKKGPICIKCGKRLNVREGFWHEMSPLEKGEHPRKKIKGFRIPQLILPLNSENLDRWERILEKYESYGETEFKNEVLGVSDSIGTRLITKEELVALCQDYTVNYPPKPQDLKYQHIVGGVDWSGGGELGASRTVVWVWGIKPNGVLRTLYFKIFPGRNQIDDVNETADIFNSYRCQLVCGDAGVGAVANSVLKKKLGAHRVYQVQYSSVSKQVKFNGVDKWLIDKTTFIDNFMLLLKRKGVEFPSYSQMAQPIEDILNEYEEVTKTGQRVWRHSPELPDDSLHAMVFGYIASKIVRGDLRMYSEEVGEDF